MWTDILVEHILNISGNSRNLATVGLNEKNFLLTTVSRYLHNSPRQDNFNSFKIQQWAVLYPALSTKIIFFENKVGRIFVPKFYHDKKDTNFLKFLSYVGEHGPDNSRCKLPHIEGKLYQYKKTPSWIINENNSNNWLRLAISSNIFQIYWCNNEGI